MKKKIRYTDGPIVGELRVIKDFLPPPEELVHAPTRVKITMALNLETWNFFKREAKKYRVPYQKMISNLLDAYTARHETARISRREPSQSHESAVADLKRDWK